MSEDTATDGTEAQAAQMSQLAAAVQAAVHADPVALYRLTDEEAGNLVYRIVEHVAALVARARADGVAEERERIRGVVRVVQRQARANLNDAQGDAAVAATDWVTAALDRADAPLKDLADAPRTHP